MNRIEGTWKLFVQIATFGLYNAEIKKVRKKTPAIYHSSPDAIDLRARGANRKKEVASRCPE